LDLGELGIGGVTVTLYDDLDGDGVLDPGEPVIATTITNSAGNYLFSGLDAGNYLVVVTSGAGPVAGAVSTTGGNTIAVTGLGAGSTVLTADFGYLPPFGTITGSVLVDTNGDSLGDNPVGGVLITLKDSLGADVDSDLITPGIQPTTFTTGPSGSYTFTVPPGNYQIVQTQPLGYLTVGDGDTTVAGDDATNTSPTDNTIPVTVIVGETDNGNLFVELQPCTITDLSFANLGLCNDNGTPSSGTDDFILSEVTVTFANKPATGNLVISGAALHASNTVTTIAVGSTSSASTHVFSGVKLKANAMTNAMTATFSADTVCTYTENTSAVSSCSATVACPSITVTPSVLPFGAIGTAYSQTPTVSGGGPGASYLWSATGLPAGLSINSSTGQITGTPTTAGAATIRARFVGLGSTTCMGSATMAVAHTCCPQITVGAP
jgi:SdrD B-like domain/Putative Ig domain